MWLMSVKKRTKCTVKQTTYRIIMDMGEVVSLIPIPIFFIGYNGLNYIRWVVIMMKNFMNRNVSRHCHSVTQQHYSALHPVLVQYSSLKRVIRSATQNLTHVQFLCSTMHPWNVLDIHWCIVLTDQHNLFSVINMRKFLLFYSRWTTELEIVDLHLQSVSVIRVVKKPITLRYIFHRRP